MKMSDVFKLPVETDSDGDILINGGHGYIFPGGSADSSITLAAAHAINCHDNLVQALVNICQLYDGIGCNLEAAEYLEAISAISEARGEQ